MAWSEATGKLNSSQFTAYAYCDVDWNVYGGRCEYTHVGGITSPYNFDASATGTLYWWEGGTWHSYKTGTAHFNGYGDLELCRTSDYFERQEYDRSIKLSCDVTMMGATGSAILDYTVPHYAKIPSGLTASRVSDNRVDLSWTLPDTSLDKVGIAVSIDGGSWSETYISGSASSYSYTAATAGHSYAFKLRGEYQGSQSDWSSASATVTMTPLPPTSITTVATTGTNVTVTLENPSTVASSVTYQIGDGENWGAEVTGQNTQSFSVDMGAYHYIRVKNVNATGESAWLTSDYVYTVTKPDKPSWLAPVNPNVDMGAGIIRWEWTYSSPDKSDQTYFTIIWEKNGVLQTPIVQSSANHYYEQDISAFSVGDVISASVSVKGASSTASDGSAVKTVTLMSAPTVSITSPSATVTGMPISLAATYSDMAGFTCKYAHVSLTQNGRVLFDEDAIISGSSITASLDVSEFLPANGATYTVVLDVRSSSGLQGSANATFTTAFNEPQAGELSIVNDPDTGYASLLATFDNASSDVEYSGATNSQFDTEAGYVKALTVEGQSEASGGTLSSITSVGVQSNGTTTTITTTLRSAGTIHDQLQVEETACKVARKVGYVDLGSLSWSAAGTSVTGTYRMSAAVSGIKRAASTSAIPNVLCAVYDAVTGSNTYNANKTGVSVEVGSDTIRVYDPNYNTSSSAAAFKTAMNGVYLFYELATPTEDALSDISLIQLGTAATVLTDLDSTFAMTGWDGSADAVSISVARVNADGITPLITDGASGAGAVDKYAPLNTTYQYAVTTMSAAHAVKTVYVDNIIETDLWFAYWNHKDGDTVTEMMASAKWNPEQGGIQLSRPQKTRVYYAGRKDPVSYDGSAVALSETPSWVLVDRDEKEPFVQLIEDGGRGVYKSCDGWVYHADFDLTLNPKYIAIGYYGGMMLNITRIAGEQL